jgi:hypothetical protein
LGPSFGLGGGFPSSPRASVVGVGSGWGSVGLGRMGGLPSSPRAWVVGRGVAGLLGRVGGGTAWPVRGSPSIPADAASIRSNHSRRVGVSSAECLSPWVPSPLFSGGIMIPSKGCRMSKSSLSNYRVGLGKSRQLTGSWYLPYPVLLYFPSRCRNSHSHNETVWTIRMKIHPRHYYDDGLMPLDWPIAPCWCTPPTLGSCCHGPSDSP